MDYAEDTALHLSQIRRRMDVAKSRGWGDVRANASKDITFLLGLVDDLVDPGPKKAEPSKGVVKTLSDVSKGKSKGKSKKY